MYLKRVIDLDSPPEIGVWYSVPTYSIELVEAVNKKSPNGLFRTRGLKYDLPVFLPAHEDGEILGFPIWHYHVDFRFMSDNMIRRYIKLSYSLTKSTFKTTKDIMKWMADNYLLVRCKVNSPDYSSIKWKDLMCRQEYIAPESSITKIKDVFINKKIKNNKCPHKGMNLDLVPCLSKGIKVCPMHGLKCDIEKFVVVG